MMIAMDRKGLIAAVRRWICVSCFIATLSPLLGCATTSRAPEMVWVRTDGRRIGDDPVLLQQGKTDIAVCNANLDPGTPTETARGCMGQKGYVLVQRDQAEDVRAAYASGAAQRATPSR
jgi:hypothetical protein